MREPYLSAVVYTAQAVEYAAHNYSLFLLGVMILWFGWYGFNPGSALAILPAGFSLPVQQVPDCACEHTRTMSHGCVVD